MIKAKTLLELECLLSKATAKSKDLNLQIVEIEFRRYGVQGSNDNFYEVVLGIDNDGLFFIACTCLGGLNGNGCKHAAKAFKFHTELCQNKMEAKKAEKIDIPNAPLLPNCDRKTEKVGRVRI